MHPLWWGLLAILTIAGVGLYAETVGFYELDDFNEHHTDDHRNSDSPGLDSGHDQGDDHGDDPVDDSESLPKKDD